MLAKPTENNRQSELIRKVLSMLELVERPEKDNLVFNHVTLLLV